MNPGETYYSLMLTIRDRFEIIESMRTASSEPYARAETAAFHGRKIIEGIAFGCLVAIENGLKTVPRDARGQWSAENIFKSLKTKNILTLPSPSLIRQATADEYREDDVKTVVEGITNRRLTHDELIKIYQSLHAWLHETNPYVRDIHTKLHEQKAYILWEDLTRLRLFIERHFIAIQGAAYFCVLWDSQDNQTKVISATAV